MAARSGRGATREKRMSLGQHLIELRKRLFRSALAILVATVAGWFLADFVWNALREPIITIAKAHNATINYSNITSAFDLKIQIALTVGVVISSPFWLYQVFAFLVPGLTGKEKRYTFGFFFTAIATPAADVMSMFLLAIPMVVLYFMAVGIAFWHDAVAQRKSRTVDSELSTPSAA